jgi:TonB family protein
MRLPALVVSTLLVVVTQAPVHEQAPADLDGLLPQPPSPGVEALLLAHVADARAAWAADEAADLAKRVERLLASPPTPATEVLLIEGAADARVTERWKASLAHADPLVRAAAARAVRVSLRAELRPALEVVIASETDPLAASEQAGALIELTRRPNPAALAAARRLPHPVGRIALLTLMRVAPASLAPHLRELWPVAGADEAVIQALSDMHETRREVVDALLATLLRDDAPGAWKAVDRVYSGGPGKEVPAAHVAAGLASASRDVREGALVALVLPRLSSRNAMPAFDPAIEAAVAVEASQDATPTTEVARELLARTRGLAVEARRPLQTLWPRVPATSGLRRASSLEGLISWLSEVEREAAGLGQKEPAAPVLDVPVSDRPEPSLVTVGDLPPGVLDGLLRGSDCPSSSARLAMGTVEYDETGRAKAIQLPPVYSQSCRHRIATLLRLGTTPVPGTRVVVVPLKPPSGFGTRLVEPILAMNDVQGGSGDTSPKLVRQVHPQYTEGAIAARVEGKIWLAVLLDEAGGIREIEVLRHLHPELNREALLAMLRWQFRPATRAGKAVPMRVVVEMEFALRK